MSARVIREGLPDALRTAGNRALGRTHSIAAALRTVTGDLVDELRRLNRLGMETEEFAEATRRTRARIIRERLKISYRGHTPCC